MFVARRRPSNDKVPPRSRGNFRIYFPPDSEKKNLLLPCSWDAANTHCFIWVVWDAPIIIIVVVVIVLKTIANFPHFFWGAEVLLVCTAAIKFKLQCSSSFAAKYLPYIPANYRFLAEITKWSFSSDSSAIYWYMWTYNGVCVFWQK